MMGTHITDDGRWAGGRAGRCALPALLGGRGRACCPTPVRLGGSPSVHTILRPLGPESLRHLMSAPLVESLVSLRCHITVLPRFPHANGRIRPWVCAHPRARRPPRRSSLPRRYLIIDVTSGCEPANRVWFVDLAAIPANPATGALDFGAYDFHKGPNKLPLVKLVDDFRVGGRGRGPGRGGRGAQGSRERGAVQGVPGEASRCS